MVSLRWCGKEPPPARALCSRPLPQRRGRKARSVLRRDTLWRLTSPLQGEESPFRLAAGPALGGHPAPSRGGKPISFFGGGRAPPFLRGGKGAWGETKLPPA